MGAISSALAIAAVTAVASVTSQEIATILEAFLLSMRWACCALSCSTALSSLPTERAMMVTRAPCRAASRPRAKPIPSEPPVMTTCEPLIGRSGALSSVVRSTCPSSVSASSASAYASATPSSAPRLSSESGQNMTVLWWCRNGLLRGWGSVRGAVRPAVPVTCRAAFRCLGIRTVSILDHQHKLNAVAARAI